MSSGHIFSSSSSLRLIFSDYKTRARSVTGYSKAVRLTLSIGLLQHYGSRDIVTPKRMCNHHIISRNEKIDQVKISDPAKFQYTNVLYSGHGNIFKSLNLIDFVWLELWQALPSRNLFPIQILLIFLIFELPPNFIFQCYRPQTWQFYLFFLALSKSSMNSQSPKN